MRFFFSRSSETARWDGGTRSKDGAFRARSPERDKATDQESILPIGAAIDDALSRAETEHAGLKRRLDSVTASAATVAGNESDEYLSRDSNDTDRLNDYETEMQKADARLRQLTEIIAHLKFIRAAYRTRFPVI